MTQINKSATLIEPRYSSDVELVFTPSTSDGCNCSEIAFVQTIKTVNDSGANVETNTNQLDRMTSGDWSVDRVPGKKYGWYGLNDNGTFASTVTPGNTTPTAASIRDTPSWSKKNTRWRFETCAICKSGADQDNVYGCKTWGFDVDDTGQVSSSSSADSTTPSSDWSSSIAAWNNQAKTQGSSNKQSPNQATFPSFKSFYG